MEATVDRFGRIILPKRLRDDFGLAPGSVLAIEERGEGILLRPVEEGPTTTLKEGILVYVGQAEGDLEEALKRHRQERLTEVAARGHR